MRPHFSHEVLYTGLIQSSARADFSSWVKARREDP
ncbi:hypothetical protein ROA7023_04574 [Roseisalinus antarcticus]|uniref:Uncharacterized protein n=1 Tax=Roseisalinus antarcticus TaxID=254357 RepID=A0A1Y5U1L7_9RHOB|nr:hypothetical protein ROA7023_04574 [Roseisalinus antarcticus]